MLLNFHVTMAAAAKKEYSVKKRGLNSLEDSIYILANNVTLFTNKYDLDIHYLIYPALTFSKNG